MLSHAHIDHSGGLPLRCYVKKGTGAERKMIDAKHYSRSVEQVYVVKGMARENRQLVVEGIEAVD